jgi:crotonobetainyl-CoA:carnitine CoA-transferase CaiB-like acyl-CoA transferase
MVGAALADMGAEVIRIEHRDRLDNSRFRARPAVHGKTVGGPLEEVSYYFHQNNRGKMGVTFNIKDAQGARLVAELIGGSDLVVENFTPGVFERAGLGFAEMSRANPRLVWLSMTSAGHTGPLSGIRTYAPIMSALAGLESLVGYDGEAPVGMLGYSFGDVNGGAHAIAVALAALYHARVTGTGQLVDFSLTETQMSVLMEPMAEMALGAPVPASQGMRHPALCPHGHYRCAGDDAWLALSVAGDEEWRRLAALVDPSRTGVGAGPGDAGWRHAHRPEIDAAIGSWTGARERDAAVAVLQALDLAATPVLSSDELARDWPADGYFELPHPVTGPDRVLTVPWHMSATPAKPPRPAPTVGEHTRLVLERILGRTPAQADALLASAATR